MRSGVRVIPAAFPCTANKLGPPVVCAATMRSSAVAPSITSGFVPVSDHPSAVRTALVHRSSVAHDPSPSATATVAVVLPAAMAGR